MQTTVAARYRLIEELGRGGMGAVWRARDERLERDVAIKLLHEWVADDPDLRARFDREAAALARLQHPHVVRLYDVAEERGRTALVMELVEGDSLADLARGRSLPWRDAARLLAPVAAALAYAHGRGVVHRDLTPANVLVERRSGRVVVSDFGLARLVRSARSVPVSGILAGTPEFWSPEQASGVEAGPASDLYSLGCVLFRLVSGRLPFEGDDRLAAGLRRAHADAPSLATVAPGVPREGVALVDALLDRDPAARPTALATARRLGAEPASLTGVTLAGPTRRPTGRPRRRPDRATIAAPTFARRRRPFLALRRGRLALLAAVVAGLAALSGGGVYALASQEPPGIDAPELVGTTLAQARSLVAAKAQAAGVEAPLLDVERRYSEDAAAGAVVEQRPAPGDHVAATGTLLVSVSLGSAFAAVPGVAGLPTAQAVEQLRAAGFDATRRYAPSRTVPPWHVVETRPAAGTRVQRPAEVEVVVSTGAPRARIPDLRGADGDDAVAALERAGFVGRVNEAPSSTESPGTVLELAPAPGTRARVGTVVTVVVAREPQWTTVLERAGADDADTGPLRVPAGARLVLAVENTSFWRLDSGWVEVTWSGDESGSGTVEAGEEGVVLEPADRERTVSLQLDAHRSADWTVRVEQLG